IMKQMIELGAVCPEWRLQVEDVLENLLDVADVLANGDTSAGLFLDVRGGGKMTCMRVRFEYPLHLELLFGDEGQDGIGRVGGNAPGLGVVVQYAVDDRALWRIEVVHNMRESGGARVEEGLNLG